MNDSFTYTTSPGTGGGTVNITMAGDPTGQSANIVYAGVDTNQHPTIIFAGIPNYQYEVQRATVVSGPYTTLTTNTAPGNGIFTNTDTSVTTSSPGAYFYRTVAH